MTDVKTKNRIMAKAQELFYHMGISAVTMDQLADELGMSKKTLYQYFPSKEALITDIIHAVTHQCDCYVIGLMNNKEVDFVHRLKSMMEYLTRNIYSQWSTVLVADLKRNWPDVWNQIMEFRRQRIFEDTARLIHEGVESGVFRKDLDEKLVVQIWATAIQGLVTPDVLSQMPYTASQVFEAITKVFFEGLLTDAGREKYHDAPLEPSQSWFVDQPQNRKEF